MIHPKSILCHKCGEVVIKDLNTLTASIPEAPGIYCSKCGTLVVSVTLVTYPTKLI